MARVPILCLMHNGQVTPNSKKESKCRWSQRELNSTLPKQKKIKKKDDGIIGFSGPRVEKGFEVQLYYAAAIMQISYQ